MTSRQIPPVACDMLMSREQNLTRLYSNALPIVRDMLYARIPNLLVWDANRITDALPVTSYTGPLDQETFDAWALTIAAAMADEQLSIAYTLMGYQRPLLQAAVRADPDCNHDVGFLESPQDYVSRLAELAHTPEMCRKLLQPGTAALTTRLYALCRQHTLFTKKKRIERWWIVRNADPDEMTRAGCEVAEAKEDTGLDDHNEDAA